MPKSAYTLFIDKLSSYTRSRDIKHEMSRYGTVVEVERDIRERSALVRFKRSDDAKYAWRKADGTKLDGATWRVEWATPSDYKFFGWEWVKDEEQGRSPSRSPSKGDRSASPPAKEGKTASTEDKHANLE